MLRTGRDSFARRTIRKRLVPGCCQWCGATRHEHSRTFDHGREPGSDVGDGRVWLYYADDDSPRLSGPIVRACSITCANAYLG